ncbi:thioesterase family protein [Gordonia hydrophobica]|uniref:Hotdog domain-containing protein n=1 Tax=Gordonia hydrophobica TaxID=40516 RepID=A0ABZ2TXM9_9ACTN|nr:hotdog domain-containing protein [Gordonia hydrophobica]MBM7366385.1 fluoroacetyl-CoA thioesterase [Gordonia hydrophobica]
MKDILGTHVNLSHDAPTVPGSTVTIEVRVVEVDGRSVVFDVQARDEHASICSGTHRRGIVDRDRFQDRITRQSEGHRP